jgi:hypothetical protein
VNLRVKPWNLFSSKWAVLPSGKKPIYWYWIGNKCSESRLQAANFQSRNPPSGGTTKLGEEIIMGKIIKVRLTEYYPFDKNLTAKQKLMEGAPVDRRGKPLYSLEDYLEGLASYVSLACDFKGDPPGNAKEFRIYGYRVEIPELCNKYGKNIEFRLVDTGGHFFTHEDKKTGKLIKKVVKVSGHEPIDVCRRNKPTKEESFSGLLTTLVLVGKP